MIKKSSGKLKLLKIRSSQTEDIEFRDIDVNPLIRDFMIREAFYMFDVDHSGDIDKREFTKLITTLGLELNEKRIAELMKEMDKDGSGTIDFEEFSAMMSKFQFGKECPMQQHLENAFNDYDKDMDGFITPEDLKKVSEELDSIAISKEESNMFFNFCKYFGREKGVLSRNDNGISKEEYMNALICLNFLIDSRRENKTKQLTSNGGNITNNNIEKSQLDSQINNASEKNTFNMKRASGKSIMNNSKESSILFN